ncbi:MAG: alpha/beta fold hydrolase [Pseudomonadota bacterium]
MRWQRALGVFVVFVGIASVGTQASAAPDGVPPVYPVEAFAKLPVITQPQLSPDGQSIAYITTVVNGRKMVVAHPVQGYDPNRSIKLPPLEEADIARYAWANNDTLLVTYTFYGANIFYRGARMEQSRLVSASFGGKAFNLVRASGDQKRRYRVTEAAFAATQSDIIDYLPDDPNHILLAIDDDMDGDPDIRKIDVRTGDYSRVRSGRKDIYNWLTDRSGKPVLGYSLHEFEPHLVIDKSKAKIWSEDAIYALLDKDYSPVDIHEDGVSALFVAPNEHGRSSLGRFDLRTGDLMEWIYSNERYDIDKFYWSDIDGQLVGTGYVDQTSKQVFLGGMEKRVSAAVNRALPNATNRILSSDKKGELWLFRSQKTGETPKLYSLNMSTKTMSIFAAPYAAIEDGHVAPVSNHMVEMRDGLNIEVFVTTPIGRGSRNLPAIMLPHGGPWSRDSAQFDYLAQFFANRGYVVLQPNFRGSSGYGQAFEDLGDQEWGGAMQDDVTDTAAWAIESGLIDKNRMCVVGWSYGGYAALMGAVKTPDLFQCSVSINGVADLPLIWSDDRKFIWYKRFRESIGENRSDLKEVSPYHRAEEISIPVLLVATQDDARVNYKHSKRMHKRLKKLKKESEYLEMPLGGHSIDIDEARIKMFEAMDAFMARHLAVEEGR